MTSATEVTIRSVTSYDGVLSVFGPLHGSTPVPGANDLTAATQRDCLRIDNSNGILSVNASVGYYYVLMHGYDTNGSFTLTVEDQQGQYLGNVNDKVTAVDGDTSWGWNRWTSW